MKNWLFALSGLAELTVGDRIEVYFDGEDDWFPSVVIGVIRGPDGDLLHQVLYDNLQGKCWQHVDMLIPHVPCVQLYTAQPMRY